MKNRKIILSISFISSLLFSCAISNEKMALITNGDIKNDIIDSSNCFKEITGDLIVSKMNAGQEFMFYLGSNNCSYCLETLPYFVETIQNTKALIYKLDSSNSYILEDLENIKNATSNKEYFPKNPQTPSLYFYKGNSLIKYLMGTKDIYSQSNLNKVVSHYTKKSSIISCSTLDSINQNIRSSKNLFFYNALYENNIEEYKKEFGDLAFAKANSIFVDFAEISLDEKNLIYSNFELSDEILPKLINLD